MLLTNLKFKVLFHSEFVLEKAWVCLYCISIFLELQHRREAHKDWGSYKGVGALEDSGGSLMSRKGQLTSLQKSLIHNRFTRPLPPQDYMSSEIFCWGEETVQLAMMPASLTENSKVPTFTGHQPHWSMFSGMHLPLNHPHSYK